MKDALRFMFLVKWIRPDTHSKSSLQLTDHEIYLELHNIWFHLYTSRYDVFRCLKNIHALVFITLKAGRVPGENVILELISWFLKYQVLIQTLSITNYRQSIYVSIEISYCIWCLEATFYQTDIIRMTILAHTHKMYCRKMLSSN